MTGGFKQPEPRWSRRAQAAHLPASIPAQHRLARGHPRNRSSARGPRRRLPTCDHLNRRRTGLSPHRFGRGSMPRHALHVVRGCPSRRRGFARSRIAGRAGSFGHRRLQDRLPCAAGPAGIADPGRRSRVLLNGSSGFAGQRLAARSVPGGQVGDPLVDLAVGEGEFVRVWCSVCGARVRPSAAGESTGLGVRRRIRRRRRRPPPPPPLLGALARVALFPVGAGRPSAGSNTVSRCR